MSRSDLVPIRSAIKQQLLWLMFLLPGIFAGLGQAPLFGQIQNSELRDISNEYTLRKNFVNRGLSSRNITCLMQDRRGYMWIGTGNGLNRFDGYDFKVYDPDPRDSNSISGAGISCLFEDRNGILWLGTADGNLTAFDRRSGDFRRYNLGINNRSGPGKVTILSIADAGNGNLWLNTKFRILHFDRSTGQTTRLADIIPSHVPDSLLQVNYHHKILSDSRHRLFYLSSGGLMRVDLQDSSLRIVHAGIKANVHQLNYFNFCDLGDDEFAISLSHAYYTFNTHTNELKLLYRRQAAESTPPNIYSAIANNGSEEIWLLRADKGLEKHNLKTGRRSLISNGMDEPLILWSQVLHMHVDAPGTIWLGWSSGLFHLHRHSLDFQNVRAEANDGLATKPSIWHCRSIFRDSRNTVWLGTDYGAYYREAGSERFQKGRPGDSIFPGSEAVNVIREDSSGYLWFGTSGWESKAWHPEDNEVLLAEYSGDSAHPFNSGVYSLYVDSNADVWVGQSRSLGLYKHSNGQALKFRPPDRADDNGHSFVFYMTERGGDDSLWIGSNDGIRIFDRGELSFVQLISSDDSSPGGLSNNAVWSLLFSDPNTLWAGTYGHGLNRLNLSTKEFTLFTDQDGLSTNTVYGIMHDELNHLWLSTGKGLSRFDLNSQQFKNFDQMDGLWSDENYFGAYFHDKGQGNMYVGGLRGYSQFNPDSVLISNTVPPMVITETRVMDTPIKRELFNGDTLLIDWRDNFVSFKFAALDYANPSKHLYAYKLVGVDRDWVYSGSRRLAIYTDLAGGAYTFQLKGTNSDRIWNETDFAITLIVKPEPWTRAEFRITLLLLICALVFLLARSRYQRAQQRDMVKRKLLERELEALRMQMNPHFLFNSLTSVQHFIMRNHPDTARDYIARFARLMRMVVETGNKERISLSEEIEILDTYLKLERERFQHRLNYTITIDEVINTDDILLPPMLLQPFVENAVVHGLQPRQGKGNIKIDIRRREHQVVYTIEDDGVGRQKNIKSTADAGKSTGFKQTSLGMHVTDKRIEMLNEALREDMHMEVTDLHDSKGRPAGTRISVVLPVMYRNA